MSDTSGPSFTRRVSGAERILNPSAEGQRTGGRLVRGGIDFGTQGQGGGNTRLSGEVIEEQKNREGRTTRVKIRTARGDIDVERDGAKPLPRKGQKVEVEIRAKASAPKGGESVVIRTENTARVADAQAATQGVAPTQTQSTRINTTPVDVAINTGTQPSPNAAASTVDVNIQTPDMQGLMEAGVTVRLVPMDAQTLMQNIEADFYTAQVSVSVIMSQVLEGLDVPLLDPAAFDVPTMQTAVTFMSASGKGAGAARVLEQMQAPTTPSPPNLLRVNTKMIDVVNLPPPIMGVSGAGVSGEATALQNALTAPLDVLPQNQSKLQTLRLAIPEAFLSAQDINVRIQSLSPPLALPSIPLAASAEATALPADKLPFVPAEQTGLLTDLRAGEIHAVITGQTADKLPTMSLFYARADTGQVFTLHAPVDSLVPGTQVTLIPLVDQTATGTQATQNLSPLPFSVFLQPSAQWPSLQELTQALNVTNPQIAQTLSTITPNPTNAAQLPPALMLFVAAVRWGDFSTWLGNKTMEAIRRSGRGDIMSRIGQEASLIARSTSGSISGDWQGVNIPLYHDGQYQKAAFYYRDHDEGDTEGLGGGKKRKYTRFIFDLSLSEMGGVQVDGLLRHDRLDIILRTQKTLSQEMQRDMRRVYTGAIGQTDFTGELSFQNDLRHWVNITPDERHVGVSA